MRNKMISLVFCGLLIIAAFIPVSGNLYFETPEQGPNQSTTLEWITLPEPTPVDMILEQSICRRMSFHSGYPGTPITDVELSTILWAAYGMTTTGGRTIYSPNGTYTQPSTSSEVTRPTSMSPPTIL